MWQSNVTVQTNQPTRHSTTMAHGARKGSCPTWFNDNESQERYECHEREAANWCSHCALQTFLSCLTIPANGTSNWNHVKSRIPMMSYWPHRKSVSWNPLSRLNGITHICDYACSGYKCQFTSMDNQLKKVCNLQWGHWQLSSHGIHITHSQCMWVRMSVCVHTYVCIIYVHVCVYVHVYVCVYVCVRAQIHVHNRRVTDALSNEYRLSVLMILGAWMRDLWKVNIPLHMVHCNANEPWKNHPHSLLKQWITLQHVCQLKVAHGTKSTTFVNPFPYKRLQLHYNTMMHFTLPTRPIAYSCIPNSREPTQIRPSRRQAPLRNATELVPQDQPEWLAHTLVISTFAQGVS